MEPKLKQKLAWSFEQAMSVPNELTPIVIDLIKIIVQQAQLLEYMFDSEGIE